MSLRAVRLKECCDVNPGNPRNSWKYIHKIHIWFIWSYNFTPDPQLRPPRRWRESQTELTGRCSYPPDLALEVTTLVRMTKAYGTTSLFWFCSWHIRSVRLSDSDQSGGIADHRSTTLEPREHQPRPTPVPVYPVAGFGAVDVNLTCSRLFLSETDTMFLLEPYCAKLLLVLFCCTLWWEVVKIQTTELPAQAVCLDPLSQQEWE